MNSEDRAEAIATTLILLIGLALFAWSWQTSDSFIAALITTVVGGFFLAMLAWYRQWPRLVHFVLVLGATIAQGSLVETFAHLRTPVLMSTVRAFDGLIVGIVFGVLAVVALQIAQYLTYLLERRTAGDE